MAPNSSKKNRTLIKHGTKSSESDEKSCENLLKKKTTSEGFRYYGPKLEERWTYLWTTGKQTPGVVPDRNPLENPPEWFDLDRFTKAQKLAKKYYLSLNIAHFIGNILLVLLPRITVPIFATGRSSTVYMVFLRILSTVRHVDCWYQANPFDKSTETHKSLAKVRRACHLNVSKLMNEKYPLKDDLWLSQFDMVMTQWSLIGPVAIRPKQCGFHNTTKEEFAEYIYFWRVIGYCMGIEDRFNCCLDYENYEEAIDFMHICFERGYKPDLDKPCPIVRAAMELTEGVFLGLNFIIPKYIISYEGFMKYWYETLEVPHEIKLDSIAAKISYGLQVILTDYLLKIPIIYTIFSAMYFRMLDMLYVKVNQVRDAINEKYQDIRYEIPNECGIYSIENKLYRPNIQELQM